MNDYKEYPDVPDLRAEAESVCLKIKLQVAHGMHEQTLAELDRLTAVHQFDPNDKSTWPKESQFYFGYQLSQIHRGSKAIALYCFEYVSGCEETSGWFNNLVNDMHHDHEMTDTYEIDTFYWSPDYLVLQAHLKSL